MKEMLSNQGNKKLRKNISIDQQILALIKEEMEIKLEMLKKMELQDQQFSHSMEVYAYPVDTRRRFNVYTTSLRRQRRRIEVV